MNRNYLFIVLFSILCVVYCQSNKNDNNNSLDRSPRQFSFWSNNFSLSRQVYDMIDIVTDVAMLTILGIPILGIFALGASVLGPAISTATGRKKRSEERIIERTKRALTYARNLFDILANLEDSFQKYEITESECQLKAVCEVHKNHFSNSEFKDFGNTIKDLIRLQTDLEEYEIIPLAKIIFGQYSDAANYGTENNDCSMIYSRCSHDLNYFLNKKKSTEHEVH